MSVAEHKLEDLRREAQELKGQSDHLEKLAKQQADRIRGFSDTLEAMQEQRNQLR